MRIIKKCEICGNKEFTNLFKGSDKLLNIEGEFTLMECNNCGVEFLNPQPSNNELKKYYNSNKYYSLKKIDKDSYKLKLKLFLYQLYYTKNKNYFCKLLFSPIKFMIRSTVIKSNIKILDIGCGAGQFLFEMKSCGLRTFGIEVGDFDKSEDLNIRNTNLIDAKYPNNYFDLITMNHVFEHLNNPHQILKEIRRILKVKGIFIIGVPNTKSLANKIFGKNWLAYDIPRHLLNYSDELLINILKKHKFKIKSIRYNSRPNQFVMSLYYLFKIKKRTGILNSVLEILFVPLTLLVNILNIGDQVEIICKK